MAWPWPWPWCVFHHIICDRRVPNRMRKLRMEKATTMLYDIIKCRSHTVRWLAMGVACMCMERVPTFCFFFSSLSRSLLAVFVTFAFVNLELGQPKWSYCAIARKTFYCVEKIEWCSDGGDGSNSLLSTAYAKREKCNKNCKWHCSSSRVCTRARASSHLCV